MTKRPECGMYQPEAGELGKRSVTIEVPLSWSQSELERRLLRMSRDEPSDAELAKRAHELELQTAELARVSQVATRLLERVELLEAALVGRPTLDAVTELVTEQDERRQELGDAVSSLGAQFGSLSQVVERTAQYTRTHEAEVRTAMAKVLHTVRRLQRTQSVLQKEIQNHEQASD